MSRLMELERQVEALREELQTVAAAARISGSNNNTVIMRATADNSEAGQGSGEIQDWDGTDPTDSGTTKTVYASAFPQAVFDDNLAMARFNMVRQRWEWVGDNRFVVAMSTAGSASSTGVIPLSHGSGWQYNVDTGTNKFTVHADHAGPYWAILCGELVMSSGGSADVDIRVNGSAVLSNGAAVDGTIPLCVGGSLDTVAAGIDIDAYITVTGTATFQNGFFSVVRLP